jgi:hypothetical protein
MTEYGNPKIMTWEGAVFIEVESLGSALDTGQVEVNHTQP